MAKKQPDLAERYRRHVRHSRLGADAGVQKSWKKYQKLTKGYTQMNQGQWYDFNYPKGAPLRKKRTGASLLTEYARRSKYGN